LGGGNISAASPKQISRIRTLYAQYLDELPQADRRRAQGFLAYRCGRIAQMHGDLAGARRSLLQALAQPLELRYRVKAVYFLLRSVFP
jgi:hypothetical protein